jgi:hypothetical protein
MGVKMNTKISFSLICLMTLFLNANASSKVYTGKPIPVGSTVNRWQFVEKGKSPATDLQDAPIVVYVDNEDYSLKFTWLGSIHEDSILYHVIPGDLISVRISANIVWDKSLQCFIYEYELESMDNSKIPIESFNIRLGFEPRQSFTTEGLRLYEHTGFHSWSNLGSPMMMPGNSVCGFGFQSSGHPQLGVLTVHGETEIIKGGSEGSSEIAKFLRDHGSIDCLTIIPGPNPERIEAAGWVSSIVQGVDKMVGHGYIPKDEFKNVREIAANLHDQLYNSKNPPFSEWSGYIESAMNELAPYKDLIEPEAWSYIVENLKYMQRNKDIVWFRE